MFSFKGSAQYNKGLDYKRNAVLYDDCSIQPVLILWVFLLLPNGYAACVHGNGFVDSVNDPCCAGICVQGFFCFVLVCRYMCM